MKYSVTKEFTFEAAHRLIENYTGKCTNNHGHSWIIKLYIESEKLDNKAMVIDFQEMKKLKDWIDNNLDHATLLCKTDPMCNYIKESGQRIYTMEGNPTSEKIGELILQEAIRLFNSEMIKVRCIEVSETCTSSAIVYA